VGFDLGYADGWHHVSVDFEYRMGQTTMRTKGLATFGMNTSVVVNGTAVPRKILFESGVGHDQPRLLMGIELRNDVPVCTYLELSEGEVRAKWLKVIRIEEWVSEIVLRCSVGGVNHATPEQRRAVLRMQRRRRDPRTDGELLAQVAEVYREHPEAPNKAIAAQFGVSGRTAARWAQYASEAGLLPKVKQGRTRI
jgi:hypothetical protein